MSYPLIILGAGASFDYIDVTARTPKGFSPPPSESKYRPPLSNDLFNLEKFEGILSHYADAQDLASDALTAIPHNMTLETYFQSLLSTTTQNETNKQRQLISFIFYLQDLFTVVTKNYKKPVNNYKALLEKIRRHAGRAVIVNFNYDLLLESEIGNIITAESIDEYISGDLKVIKVHGSCNWGYGPFDIHAPSENLPAYKYFLDEASSYSPPRDSSKLLIKILRSGIYEESIDETLMKLYLPALAIPVQQKDSFIPPKNHIDQLISLFSEIDRVLIIGWKAGDEKLLQLLKEKLPKKLPVFIVTGKNSTGIIINNLKKVKQLEDAVIAENGFDSFLKSGKCDNFLSTSDWKTM
jgi:hypothetical protein